MTVDFSMREKFEAAMRERHSGAIGAGGGGPHDPGMDQRVATLEADMKDVKGSLGRIEVTLGRMEEGLKHLATKAELVAVTGSITALEGRVGKVEKAIDETVKAALTKSIGPWQFPAILGSSAAVLIAAAAALNWLMNHGYLPR